MGRHVLTNVLVKISHLISSSTSQSKITSKVMPNIKTFVFLDLETTGLPHLEHNQTKITELCAVAVQADHIELGCFPRVHNKLSFCFNPMKVISPEATTVTGLSNELLEKQSNFSSDVVDIFKKWLDANNKPICFVAHNGNKFDYPILRAEVEKTGNSLPVDLLCIDSLVAFRNLDSKEQVEKEAHKNQGAPFEFDDDFDKILCQAFDEYEKQLTPEEVQKVNETTPKKQMISSQTQRGEPGPSRSFKRNLTCSKPFVSYKLEEVYTRLTSKPPINAHEAEGDVIMLITCAAVYGEKFIEYANENCMNFDEMPVMKPGKKIGL